MMGFNVTIANTGATIDCSAGQTVLQAAVGAGMDYPYACATGNCANCISELRAGEVSMLPYSDNALTVADIFDFLAAWFASSPNADFNRNGAINVNDIFDFLAAWFAGC